MKAETMIQWMAALLSGDYPQGRAALRTKDDKYCCLGVLCDVVKDDPEVQGAWKKLSNDDITKAGYEFKLGTVLERSLVPETLARQLAVFTTQGTLAARNDRGQGFKRIAKLISEIVELEEDEQEVQPDQQST